MTHANADGLLLTDQCRLGSLPLPAAVSEDRCKCLSAATVNAHLLACWDRQRDHCNLCRPGTSADLSATLAQRCALGAVSWLHRNEASSLWLRQPLKTLCWSFEPDWRPCAASHCDLMIF